MPALPVETLEIEARSDAKWESRFQIEIKRLSEDNRLSGRLSDERLVAHRSRIFSLARGLLTVRELAGQGRLLEARTELNRLLAEATWTGYTLSYAQALIGSVYAGLLEKYPNDVQQELPTVLGKLRKGSKLVTTEELLLQGIVMNRVGLLPSKADRVITALRNEPVIWEHLLDLLRQQKPEAAAAYVEQLLNHASEIVNENERSSARLRLIIRSFDLNVLNQAVGRLTLPDPLSATG